MQRIFAHRGASGYAPENTLEAFELAVNQLSDGIELDVHLSKDGELVVAHDEAIDRVSDGAGFICDMTVKQLKSYRFNRTHPEYESATIPLLSEVFELIKPSPLMINVELKNSYIDYDNLEIRVIELAARMGMSERILYSSFNHHSLLRIKRIDPSIYCGMLYECTMIEPWKYARAHGMNAIHPHFSELLIKHEAARSHELGIDVNTWTCNTPEQIQRAASSNVDIIITNYPDVALRQTGRG
ncbi:MAG: glycerophosphodiester phosphodiesterase [Clostridia bacterium]|nr:glycerophosphodiester phosphodiesterase [Clostridia bacterium]